MGEPNELLPVLDDQGNFTGESETRKKIHETGIPHPAVHVHYVVRIKGEYYFLCIHRAKRGGVFGDGQWDFRVAGHVKFGAGYLDTAVTELFEEIGLDVTEEDLMEGEKYWVHANEGLNNAYVQDLFYFAKDSDLSFVSLAEDEVQEVRLMSATEIIFKISSAPRRWCRNLKDFTLTIRRLHRLNT